ncbi:uncharacterized protein KY384_004293 [Bacidia gigantensis]|uniref:uncharacterized protein n=1 Tax=Bacidia gigantensis TaxID=2732470 RepID=UPI001D04A1DB|nr:uncharacterized protein KY384_004293 [Bacidia gigantensis]KAG8530936.1 hypothetical protein KY384_004293 [Bacidia gigantensis]
MPSMHLSQIRKWILMSPPIEWGVQQLREILIGALRQGPLPQHVAFVMDGNRRFARMHGIEVVEGHNQGFEALAKILEVCYKAGVKVVSIYAFSIENFKRSKYEVDALMDMAKHKLAQLAQHGDLLEHYGARIQILGQKELIKPDVLEAMDRAVEMTKGNGKAILNICCPYTSHAEMTAAIRDTVLDYSKPLASQQRSFSESHIVHNIRARRFSNTTPAPMAAKVRSHSPTSGAASDTEDSNSTATTLNQGSTPDESVIEDEDDLKETQSNSYPDVESITPEVINDHMYTAGLPPLDLLVRTSGVERLSDFMLWQAHEETEIVFLKCMWPEFDLWQFLPVLVDWQWKRRKMMDIIPVIVLATLLIIRSDSLPPDVDDKLPPSLTGEPAGFDPNAKPYKPLYKPTSEKPPPIQDNFPRAADAKSPNDLPPIPSWNKPPKTRKHATPLFIGFTRNWRLLQQTVVSYIVAGWPPSEIYVIENTGVMNSNRDGLLTLQNPFFLDHHRLTKVLGINVISTPTLLTFAQLQNFYTYTSLQKGWEHYWWAHMDTVIVSDEEYERQPYKSAYTRAVEAMEETQKESWGPLATLWYDYDRLALVRTKAFVDVGGWDTLVPFYMTDCDMHERLWMKDFKIEPAEAGKIWDVASTLDDLEILYKRGPVEKSGMNKKREEFEKNSPAYKDVLEKLDVLQRAKAESTAGRNTWQARQKGGEGEPFYRDSDGFEKGIQMWMEFGRDVFFEKWGRGPCDIRDAGLKHDDQWRVIRDWESEDVQRQYWRDKEREVKEKEKAAADGKSER